MVTLSHVRTLRGAEAGPDVDIQEPMIAAVRNLKNCGAWGLISYGNKGHFRGNAIALPCFCVFWRVAVTAAGATLVAESTVTDRYQTTVPDPIRGVLKLGKRDRLRSSVQPDGAVILERVSPEDVQDPVLGDFRAFRSRDMEANPDRLKAFDGSLRERIQALVGHVDVDLDKPLSPDDEWRRRSLRRRSSSTAGRSSRVRCFSSRSRH